MTPEGTARRLKNRLLEIFYLDDLHRGALVRGFLYLTRVVGYVGREFARDVCGTRAAALAYTTILSLVPVTALFVLYFKSAGKLDAASSRLQQWILLTFVAESAQNVTVYIDQFVENLHTKTLGTIGVVGLVVTAYLTFRTIEVALNDIWKVRSHRGFIARFQILATILIVAPALLLASIYASGKFQEFRFFRGAEPITGGLRTLFVAAPWLLTLLSFFLVFKLLPNTRVRNRPALIAAAIAAILFEAAKTGFNFYVAHVVSVSKIYGTLGLVPILFLWIYLSWLIILIGVEIAYVLQNFRSVHEEALLKRTVSPLDLAVHDEWGLAIALALTRRFLRGEGPVTKEDLAKDTGLKIGHVQDHLGVLVRAGLLARVEAEEETGYLLAKPADGITGGEIVELFRAELGLPRTAADPGTRSLRDLAG
jgi:membrane protein